MTNYTLLGISGALRAGSFNTQLVKEAARVFDPASFGMADLNLPLYDGDIEAASGIPAAVQTLADQIKAADAIVISTPEYNQSLSGVLKNALDWVSRVPGDSVWQDKPVALMSAAAGRSGGARGNYALRLAMQPFKTRLIQAELLVASPSREFEDGKLVNEGTQKRLSALMDTLKAEVARG